jgi:single-stranded DNA-binding protein
MSKIRGTVFELLGEKSYGDNKSLIEFVISFQDGNRESYATFTAFGKLVQEVSGLRIGDDVSVTFTPSSRKWSKSADDPGRWFTSLVASEVSIQASMKSKSEPIQKDMFNTVRDDFEPDVTIPQKKENEIVSDTGADDDLPF